MANLEHLNVLHKGVAAWNLWRRSQPDARPDLTDADFTEQSLHRSNSALLKIFQGGNPEEPTDEAYIDLRNIDFSRTLLSNADLRNVDLRGANLAAARLGGARLDQAQLDGSDLSKAYLRDASLSGASIRNAQLREACLHSVDFYSACLEGSDLTGADLTEARLLSTDLRNAVIVNCDAWGAAVWNVQLQGAEQSGILVGSVSVDNLALAQFFDVLLMDNLRNTIEVVTRKIVLVLGRFSERQKPVLDQVRQDLAENGYVPVVFDFEVPTTRNLTETVGTLAHLSRFVVADITDAKSVPQELERIIPDLPSVPIAPLLRDGAEEYGMFGDFASYPQVLEVHRYRDIADLHASFSENVVGPAEKRAEEIAGRRLLTLATLEQVLDSLLPTKNKEVGREAYEELLSALKHFGLCTQQGLTVLFQRHGEAILRSDTRTAQRLVEGDPEALESYGASADRLAAGVFYSQVGLVRLALSLELGTKWDAFLASRGQP